MGTCSRTTRASPSRVRPPATLIADDKMPGDIAGIMKSLMDNARDLEAACFPQDPPQGEDAEESTDPVLVIETDSK